MNKVLRVLATTGLAALAGSALFLGASVASADTPDAPSVVAGDVSLDGADAPQGTLIESRVPGKGTCGTYIVTQTGLYVIQHPAFEPNQFPCGGIGGDDLQFYVNGILAVESPNVGWDNTTGQAVDLSATSATETPEPTDDGDGTPDATAVNTPGSPDTGQGLASDSGAGAAWLLVALGVGAVAFGASGLVVARRSR